ncbi:MAG: hypothetical protein U1E78_00460 [Gammaproteobacteria bacterium]
MRRILIFIMFMSMTTVAVSQNYVGLESSGVMQRGVDKYDDQYHWRPRLMFGHLNEPSTPHSNWGYGWEAGAIYLAPAENRVGELSGFGADALFVASNNFSGSWSFFYKLGAGLEKLSFSKSSRLGREDLTSTILYGVGKLGLGYEFKNGIGLFISENYQTKPIGHPVISYDGFSSSLGITYSF